MRRNSVDRCHERGKERSNELCDSVDSSFLHWNGATVVDTRISREEMEHGCFVEWSVESVFRIRPGLRECEPSPLRRDSAIWRET
jgi:hypothetical protein